MSVKCQAIIDAMNALAPARLAYEWDNVGLLVGDPQQDIHKVLFSLDVTDKVVDEAVAGGADMIIAHHPLIFKAIKKLRFDLSSGRLLQKIIQHDIAVFAAHTNLDIAQDGVNDVLAKNLGLSDTTPLAMTGSEKLVKLVVFVPESHADMVRTAMVEKGAGYIGNYSHCTFNTQGIGTFMPHEGTQPFIGQQGRLERVRECRIETIMPEMLVPTVLKAMLAVHPYEEVAYDLYPLCNEDHILGLGRIGNLQEKIGLADFVAQVKKALALPYVTVAGNLATTIQRVAVCGGSGASLLEDTVRAGADVFITGDIKYHEAQQAVNLGIAVIDAGHFGTEQPVVSAMAKYLQAQPLSVEIMVDSVNKNILTVC